MHAAWLTALLAFAQSSEPPRCTLAEGDTALCRRAFLASRLAACLAPSYSYRFGGRTVSHGLVWELSFDIPREGWEKAFAIGAPVDEVAMGLPPAKSAFYVSLAAAFALYPADLRLEGRVALRTRVLSLAFPESPSLSFLHLSLGLGGYASRLGVGPRAELRLRIGHIAWGGLALCAGYQPALARDLHQGDIGIGFEAPWVWWW